MPTDKEMVEDLREPTSDSTQLDADVRRRQVKEAALGGARHIFERWVNHWPNDWMHTYLGKRELIIEEIAKEIRAAIAEVAA